MFVSRGLAAALGVLASGASVHAQNVDVRLFYDSRFNQISAAPTTPFTNFGQAILSANGTSVAYADVTDPLFDIHGLDDPGGTGTFQVLLSQQSTRSALLAAMPDGEYQFYWENANGDPFSASLIQPFAAGLWPAQIPAFTSSTRLALAGMNPDQPLSVTVNQFAPSPMSNQNLGGLFINLWAAGDYGAVVHAGLGVGSGAGGATAVTRTIPAGTLQPNTTYWITWIFSHQVNSPGFPGPGTARSEFRNSTRFAFTTGDLEPDCPADFNNDGIANSADFFEYLTAFFVGLPNADFNDDSQINSQDFFEFLTAFFAGCP